MEHEETKKEKGLRQAFMERVLELLMAAFSLVAALAWNDAIQSFFAQIFGQVNTVIAKIVYAIVVTGIVVWIGLRLSKLSQKYSSNK